MTKDANLFSVLCETNSTGKVAFLKSLLQANGIYYTVENEFSFGRGVSIIVKIKTQDLPKARELLKDFNP